MRSTLRYVPRLTLLALCAVCVAQLLWLVPHARAQSICPSVTLRNDADAALNTDTLCAAAQAWTDNGNQVFLFVTDEDPPTEDAWFAIRDEVEEGWGIYNPGNQTFARTAFAIEVTTATNHAWGHDIAFGETVFNTPLDNDATVARLEGQLKNKVAAGDLTAAFADTLTTTFTTAFPNATQPDTGTTPNEPPNSGTTPTQAAPESSTGLGWIVRGAGIVLAALLVGGGGLIATPTLIMPALKRRRQRQELQQHLDELAGKVGSLLYAARTLFTGETAEETTLWKLFLVYGGDKYPELAQEVREWAQHSMTALADVLVLHSEMDQREPGKSVEDVSAMVRAYEMMYLTLVGTNPAILGMNDEQFKNFIDPMAGGVEPPAQESGLVAQIRDLRRQLGEQPLRAKLMVVDPKDVDADGVFGYAGRIKDTIARLSAAQDTAPKSLATARQACDQAVATTSLPVGLTPGTAFGAVIAHLAAAETESEQARWLTVDEHAAAATAMLAAVQSVLPVVTTTVNEHHHREQAIQEITAAGYQLAFLPDVRHKTANIIREMYEHLAAGEIERVREAVQNLHDQSTANLAAAQARVALREHNASELARLAAEVARVEQLREATTPAAWQALQTYPDGNWRDIGTNYDQATGTLRRLFDDPANAADLTSEIERKNSMEQQAFDAAEHDLTEAFAALREAEEQLAAITARLASVREVETNGQTMIAAVEAALKSATARRDRDHPKIDPAVDQQLVDARSDLERARQELTNREFIAAGALLNQARSRAVAAEASADEQARAIDTLFGRLNQTKGIAAASVAAALQEQHALTAAAQQAATASILATAQQRLNQAQAAETTLAGKEDRALGAALQETLGLYDQAATTSEQARQQIQADKQAYEKAIAEAQAALAAAQSSLSSARGYVNHTDAGGVGGTAWQEAQTLLTPLPSYGANINVFLRLAAQALRARQLSETAMSQARSRIAEVEAAREVERRRREEAERRRRQAEDAERRRRDESRRASSRAWGGSSWSSSSRSSSRSSSFGRSSSSSRSSSMGSSRRR